MHIEAILQRGQDRHDLDLSFTLPTWQEIRLSTRLCRAILSGDDTLIAMTILRDTATSRLWQMMPISDIADIITAYKDTISLSTVTFPLTDDIRISHGYDTGTLRQLISIEEQTDLYMKDGDIQHLLKLYDLLPHTRRRWWMSRVRRAAHAFLYSLSVGHYIRDLYATTLFRPSRRSRSGIHFGWYSIALQVAESGVFGDIDQVLDARFHDVAIYLISKQQEADQQEREMKAMTKY